MSVRPSVAVVGCGAWGMHHVRIWSGLGCLKAVCDIDPRRLESVRAGHPAVETHADLGNILARPDIAGVVLATPAHTHAGLALAAIQAGKDVLVEKPMALTAREGRELLDAAERAARVLLVGHVLEYHPAIVRLRGLVGEGSSLGPVCYLYSNRLNLGRFRAHENALWSFAPHDIALMLRIVGAMPEEVACHGAAYLTEGVADMTVTTLRFLGTLRAHIFVSWLHPSKEQRLVVVGERQMAVFDDTRPWPEKLLLYPHRVETRRGWAPVANRAEAVAVTVVPGEPLRAECEEFLDCMRSRRRPLTDAGSGVRVLDVLEAAQASLEARGLPRRPSPAPGAFVHPSATVDAGAEIGPGTRVWHYSHVMEGARLGRDCVLGQNVFVGRHVRIGDGVKLQNNVSVYEGVELEDGVFCGPSVVFTNVLRPRSEIERKDQFQKTIVKRGATLGANSTIVCGVTIGRYAFVAAGAVVTGEVPDHALVVGIPARIRGWVCRCGARLEIQGEAASCRECSRRYPRLGKDWIEPA